MGRPVLYDQLNELEDHRVAQTVDEIGKPAEDLGNPQKVRIVIERDPGSHKFMVHRWNDRAPNDHGHEC